MKLVLKLSALVALFSFSACSLSTTTPYHESKYEYSLGVQVGTDNGLVYPTDISNCIPTKAEDMPPLPKNVPNATWFNTGSPPAKYSKDVKVTVYFDSPNIINRTQGPHGHPSCNSTVFAYTYADKKIMHLPNPCTYPQTDAYARLTCHEMGHVNGWPGYHGDL